MLEGFTADVRHGLRLLGRAPGLSLVIVATLGLALAATVATFGVLNATLLAALPFHEPERVVFLEHRYADFTAACSAPSFLDYRRETRAFASLSATVPWNANLTGAGEPERLRGLLVSADFFETLGVSAWRGRTFRPEEEQPGQERVVLLSHGLWQRRFGSDPGLLGATLRLNGDAYAVVGIMAPGFRWGRGWGREAQADVWVPYALTASRTDDTERGNEYLDVYGRLQPGVTRDQGQVDLDAMAAGLRARFPDRYTAASGWRLAAVPIHELLVGAQRPGLLLVFAAVSALLLAAATNVAGLLLARAAGRRREVSVRAALGASRGRLVRQLLTEALVLAAASGAAGLVLARLAVAALGRIDPVTLPRAQPIAIDATVAVFTLGATLLVALLSGLAPAWSAARLELMASLRSAAPPSAGGRDAARARRGLVMTQTAVALALLVGAGLLARSLAALQRVPTGFRSDALLVAELQLPRSRYGEPAARVRFQQELLDRLAGSAGVGSAALTSELPLGGSGNSGSFEIEGRPVPPREKQPHAEIWSAAPAYFATLGIPLRRGRGFEASDGPQAAAVAIVNETLARRFFSGEDPIGRRIDFEGAPGSPYWRAIVGVVGDVRDRRLDTAPGPQIYTPYAQRPEAGMFLVVRTEAEPAAALPALRAAVHGVDGDLPLFNVTTMQRVTAAHTRDRRAATAAIGAFAGSAVLLVALGLYGLLGQVVRDRVPEIGVRIALGARRAHVMRLVLGEGMRLLAYGMAAGVAVSLVATRLLRGLVFGVAATDPATYLVVASLLTGVALAACALPAWRATRIDPTQALRAE
jgi:predicted permease